MNKFEHRSCVCVVIQTVRHCQTLLLTSNGRRWQVLSWVSIWHVDVRDLVSASFMPLHQPDFIMYNLLTDLRLSPVLPITHFWLRCSHWSEFSLLARPSFETVKYQDFKLAYWQAQEMDKNINIILITDLPLHSINSIRTQKCHACDQIYMSEYWEPTKIPRMKAKVFWYRPENVH
jgi:hypothetical protein